MSCHGRIPLNKSYSLNIVTLFPAVQAINLITLFDFVIIKKGSVELLAMVYRGTKQSLTYCQKILDTGNFDILRPFCGYLKAVTFTKMFQ